MALCYQCWKPAEQTEVYDGIPIGTCEDGHRTGKVLEGQYQEREEILGDWSDIFIKKAV